MSDVGFSMLDDGGRALDSGCGDLLGFNSGFLILGGGCWWSWVLETWMLDLDAGCWASFRCILVG